MPESETLERLPLDKVRLAEDNLRTIDETEEEFTELVDSIRSVGVLQPVVVTANDDGSYTLVDGHRRRVASERAEQSVIPAVIRTMTDAERVEAMLVTALQRRDLKPTEEATGYYRLIEMGMDQKDLAQRIGRSSKHVSSRLALLELPRPILDKIDAGQVPLSAAPALRTMVTEGIPEDDILGVAESAAQGRNAEQMAENVIGAFKRDALIEEIRAKTEERGLKFHLHSGYGGLPQGIDTLNSLGIDSKVHRKLDCHGIVLYANPGQKPKPEEACFDSGSHKRKGSEVKAAGVDEKAAAQARDREARKQQREAEAVRLAQRQRAVKGIKTGEANELIYRSLLETAHVEHRKAATMLLGLEPEMVDHPYEKKKDGSPRQVKNYEGVLLAYTQESGANLRRAALAVAIASTIDGYGGEYEAKRLANDLVTEFFVEVEDSGDDATED